MASKIAILGGSFNPPSMGHIQLAWEILKSCNIDEIWFSPVYSHNHGKNLIHTNHRLAMCELACKQDSRFKVFNYEILHRIEGGTYNFLSKLLSDAEYKDFQFHYVIGMDVANEFHRWARYEDLQGLVPFIVHPRQGDLPTANWFLKKPHIFIEGCNKVPQVSSTIIRELIKKEEIIDNSLKYLMENLPPDVYNYIKSNQLYV